MRRLLPLLAPLATALLAACATTPVREPQKPVLPPSPPERGELIGLDAADLGARFGQPQFQVREGSGTKLQWRGTCVLDAFLYPEGTMLRVTHVETRSPSGSDVDQLACIAALSAR